MKDGIEALERLFPAARGPARSENTMRDSFHAAYTQPGPSTSRTQRTATLLVEPLTGIPGSAHLLCQSLTHSSPPRATTSIVQRTSLSRMPRMAWHVGARPHVLNAQRAHAHATQLASRLTVRLRDGAAAPISLYGAAAPISLYSCMTDRFGGV